MPEDNTNQDQEFSPEIQAEIQAAVEQRVAKETEGLVNKRNELLKEAKEAKGKLRDIQDRYGEDFSKFDKLLEDERKRKEADMSIEEKLQSQYENEKKQLTEMYAKESKEKNSLIEKKDKALRKYLIDAQLEAEITRAGGRSNFLKPALTPQLDVIAQGDDYTVMVMERGAPKLKLDGTPMGITDLINQYKQDESWGPAFLASGANGGEANGNSFQQPNTQVKSRSQMTYKERAEFIDKNGDQAYFALPE